MSFADDLRKTADEVNYKNSSEYKAAQKKDFINRHQNNLKSYLINYILAYTKEKCQEAANEGYCSIAKYEFDGFYQNDRYCSLFIYDKTVKAPSYMDEGKGAFCDIRWRGRPALDSYTQKCYKDGIDEDLVRNVTDENVDVVLSRYYVFSEEDAIEISKRVEQVLFNDGIKCRVHTKMVSTYYVREPSYKFMDKKRKIKEYEKPHALFTVSASW